MRRDKGMGLKKEGEEKGKGERRREGGEKSLGPGPDLGNMHLTWLIREALSYGSSLWAWEWWCEHLLPLPLLLVLPLDLLLVVSLPLLQLLPTLFFFRRSPRQTAILPSFIIGNRRFFSENR